MKERKEKKILEAHRNFDDNIIGIIGKISIKWI
jgi:hypothetical protein